MAGDHVGDLGGLQKDDLKCGAQSAVSAADPPPSFPEEVNLEGEESNVRQMTTRRLKRAVK